MARPSKRETSAARKGDHDDSSRRQRQDDPRHNPDEFDNEDVIKMARQFPIVLRRPLIYGMLIIVVGLLPWAWAVGRGYSWVSYAAWWMLISVIVLAVYWLLSWVGWYFSVFVLTDKRIVVTRQRGFFDRTVSELALNNIQNVTYQVKGMQAAIFHFGDISIATLSGSGGFDIRTVHRPERFARAVIKACGLSESNDSSNSRSSTES